MIDYSVWDQLLKEYVNNEGRVDYKRWQLEAQQDLTQWLESISNFPQKQVRSEEGLTLLINLYNALVIDRILKKYPIQSIIPRFLGIPNWIAFFRFFSQSVYDFQNQPVSLNDLEHKMLRRKWQEPRIHFALVCAAIGCPLLRNEAYQPTRIEEQLTEDASRFINNSDKVNYLSDQNILQCSKIFKWYEKDFLRVASSVPSYINQYLAISITESVSIQYLPYNWSLNEQESSR